MTEFFSNLVLLKVLQVCQLNVCCISFTKCMLDLVLDENNNLFYNYLNNKQTASNEIKFSVRLFYYLYIFS